jgi:hypothetical protein
MATNRTLRLGRAAGLHVTAGLSVVVGSLVLWVLAAAGAVFVLNTSLGIALLAGLLVVLLHWIAVSVHVLGHTTAARRTGYPANGIRLWGLLSAIGYPGDEPPLPTAIHVRRALGGPLASAIFSLVVAVLVVALRPIVGTAWWLLIFLLLDTFLVGTLGALLPLDFADGGTLLRLRRERAARSRVLSALARQGAAWSPSM